MMLIATTVAIALVASTAFAAAGVTAPATADTIPPMIVTVTTAADLSPSLVKALLAETDAIWRPSGITLLWQAAARIATPAEQREFGPFVPNSLHVIIGENRGSGTSSRVPLGWIVFDDVTVPEQEIYLSYANARQMLEQARGVVGLIDQMPIMQRETLLARAMGRALAHELGHYLLASKVHTERGLMKATMTASELFMPDSGAFRLEPAQRRSVAARLRGEPLVASR